MNICTRKIVNEFVKNKRFSLLILVAAFETVVSVTQGSERDIFLLEVFLRACGLAMCLTVLFIYTPRFLSHRKQIFNSGFIVC